MASFDYITSADLRESLESDYAEMRRCLDARAAKAVHVLAGSVVEALLSDLLIALEIVSDTEAYKMSFAELVDRSRKESLVTLQVAELASAIRGYRNLIHPGRAIRTAEHVDEHSSQIAASLVELITREVAAQRQKVYGLTAEQIVGKLEKDTSAAAIAEHLLSGVRGHELERLLLHVVPERHSKIDNPFDLDSALDRTFRIAYQKADRPLKEKIAKDYARRLKEDAGPVIDHYDENFFQMDFFDHLDTADCEMVRQHLLAAMTRFSSYERIAGLGARLAGKEIEPFVDSLIRRATYPKERWKRGRAESYLSEELASMPDDRLAAAVRRLQAWQRTFDKQQQITYENVVRRLLGEEEKFDPSIEDDDLPF